MLSQLIEQGNLNEHLCKVGMSTQIIPNLRLSKARSGTRPGLVWASIGIASAASALDLVSVKAQRSIGENGINQRILMDLGVALWMDKKDTGPPMAK